MKDTIVNVRESLNKIDWNTNNKYDLRNIYDSCSLTKDQKLQIANMLYEEKAPNQLYSTLMGFYKGK